MRAHAGTIYYQKSPYLFFPYLESMYYKYLPCQILSHEFNEKCDFLNNEFSIRLPAITQFKNGLLQKREVGSRRMSCHIFSKASVDNNTRRRIKHEPCTPLINTNVATFVLMSWLDDVKSSLDPTLSFELGRFWIDSWRAIYREFVVQKVGLASSQSHGLNSVW